MPDAEDATQWFNANVQQMPSESSVEYASEFQRAAMQRGDQDSERQWAEFIEHESAQ